MSSLTQVSDTLTQNLCHSLIDERHQIGPDEGQEVLVLVYCATNTKLARRMNMNVRRKTYNLAARASCFIV